MGLCTLSATVFAFPSGAGATTVSDPGLSSLILNDPEPGWTQAPPPTVSVITSRLEKIDSNGVAGETVNVAAKMWAQPTGETLLAITLSQWPSNLANYAQIMHDAFDNECVSVTGNDPTTTTPVPGLSGSMSTLCTAPDNSAQLSEVAAMRGNYLEVVESIGANGSATVGLSELGVIAKDQFGMLPAPSSSQLGIFSVALGAIVIVALVIAVLVVIRETNKRRGRSGPVAVQLAPVVPAPQGWAYTSGGCVNATPSPLSASLSALSGVARAPVMSQVAHAAAITEVTSVPGLFAPEPEEPPVAAPQLRDDSLPSLGDFLSSPEISAAPSDPATPAAPTVGWHQEGADAYERRYWDGSSWTGVVRWNGASWVAVE